MRASAIHVRAGFQVDEECGGATSGVASSRCRFRRATKLEPRGVGVDRLLGRFATVWHSNSRSNGLYCMSIR